LTNSKAVWLSASLLVSLGSPLRLSSLTMRSSASRTEIRLRKSGGGVFEITVDGKLAYLKKASGRFPTDEEVLAIIGS